MFSYHMLVEVIRAIHRLFVVVLFWSTLQVTWLNRSFLVIYQFSEMFSGSENMHCLLKHINNFTCEEISAGTFSLKSKSFCVGL